MSKKSHRHRKNRQGSTSAPQGLKIRAMRGSDGELHGYFFWCPACQETHPFRIPEWNFDGNFSEPTFTPSLRVLQSGDVTQCHLNLTAGKLIYHGDTPQPEWAGKTVELPFLPPEKDHDI